MSHIKNCPLCSAVVDEGQITCAQCEVNLKLASLVASLTERVVRLEGNVLPKTTSEPIEIPTRKTEPETSVEELNQANETTLPSPPLTTKQSSKIPSNILQSDFWLNKIGMGLLLLALAFLFNYAVEQGWLTPAVRVAIGLVVGTALLGIGYRIYGRNRHFSQVLLGGGIAAYYLTGFAAFQLYELVSFLTAFSFMVLVTLLAFFLSLRQEEAVLSLIGTVGGLATPFLLYTGDGNIPGLIAYTCLLIGAVSAIYFYRGWQLLLWTAVFGGWIILIAAYYDSASSDYWAIQIGIIFNLIVSWIIPVWREVITAAYPDRWPPARLGFADSVIPPALQNLLNTHVYVGTVIPPFIAMLFTWEIWSLANKEIGIVTLVGAFVFAAAVWVIKQTQVRHQVWRVHGWTAALLLMAALAQLLEGDALFFAWALEAAALELVAVRWGFPLIEKGGVHVFWLVVGGWLASRLFGVQQDTAVWNVPAMVDLGVIALAVAVFSRKDERQFYWLAAHIALLIWLWRELGSVTNGQGLVSIAWGIYALVLLGIGLKFRFQRLRMVAIATLFVLAGKLILVDLAALRAVWRILLFAGVGGLFLLISYYYQSFLSAPEEKE